jgi:tRNA isopentenyl-2-thiomethyl-A-37 hydroxylase MiaE
MEQILNELQELHLVLQYSTEHAWIETALTTGERIMVNQQRAKLFKALDGIPNDFIQSDVINIKINKILYLIKSTNWEPKEINHAN